MGYVILILQTIVLKIVMEIGEVQLLKMNVEYVMVMDLVVLV